MTIKDSQDTSTVCFFLRFLAAPVFSMECVCEIELGGAWMSSNSENYLPFYAQMGDVSCFVENPLRAYAQRMLWKNFFIQSLFSEYTILWCDSPKKLWCQIHYRVERCNWKMVISVIISTNRHFIKIFFYRIFYCAEKKIWLRKNIWRLSCIFVDIIRYCFYLLYIVIHIIIQATRLRTY